MNAYVERGISTPEKLSFNIVLERKIFLRDQVKAILTGISERQQVNNELTGLINSTAYLEVINELMDFLYDAQIEAVFCIVTVEGFPNIRMNEGREKVDEILGKIGNAMRTTFRVRDIMGYLGFGKFAVLMVRTFEDEVVYPLKRLESNLRKEGVLNSKLSYNARYQKIDMEMDIKDIIEQIKIKNVDYKMEAK